MAQRLVSNAFSLNMLSKLPATIKVEKTDVRTAAYFVMTAESVVGHADTAAVFADQLGVPVAVNRATVTLNKGDVMLVGQYRGPRLPEGATKLPEGASIEWVFVSID